MWFSSLKKAVRMLSNNEKVSNAQATLPIFVDIYGRNIHDGNEFFYPKKVRGVPVFTVDSIYKHHLPIINEIIGKSGIGSQRKTNDNKQLIDELYAQVIKRFIAFAHMLPASEYHHHSTTGGLIAHSLQTSLFALQYSRDRRPESTKYQDIDKQMEPVYRYAAWLGGLLHDAGKICRDVVVDAVEVYDGKNNRRLEGNERVPTWRPQKESLIDWAARFKVATYSVAYKPDRVHNQHNIDSALLLPKVVGKGAVFDYLVENPVNLYERISEALSGHETSVDYLSTCIRKADILSVNKDIKTINDVQLGERKLSMEAMILRTLKIVKTEWEYNVPHGHVWVLGDSVYLRHTKAFDSLVKKSKQLHYTLPSDTRIVISIMEASGMLESYDAEHKLVNFAPGRYTHTDIQQIFDGQQTVPIEQLFKMRWKGTLFGSDPMPDSGQGLLISPDGKMIELVSLDGKVTRYEKAISEKPVNIETANDEQIAVTEQNSNTSTAVCTTNKDTPEQNTQACAKSNNKKKPEKVKDMEREIKPSQTPAPKQNKPSNKGIVFKNAKTTTEETKLGAEVEPRNLITSCDTQQDQPVPSTVITIESPEKEDETSMEDNQVADIIHSVLHELYDTLEEVKVPDDKQSLGYWVSLPKLTVQLGVQKPKEAITYIKEQGLAVLDGSNILIVTLSNQGEHFNAVCLRAKPEGESQTQSEPKKAAIKKIKRTKTETQKEDLGLISVLMNPKPNSLAETVKWSLEHNMESWYTETNSGIQFSISKLASLLSKRTGKRVLARKAAQLLSKYDEITMSEIEGQITYLVPYEMLNTVVDERG